MNARFVIVSAIGILTLVFFGAASIAASGPSNGEYAGSRPIPAYSGLAYSLDSVVQASIPLTTATPIRTITLTPTPVCCSNVTAGASSAMCIPTFGYYYSHSISNNCTASTTGSFTEYVEVSPNQNGPWTLFTSTQPFTRTLLMGSNSVDGNMGNLNIQPPYNWFRMRLAGTALDNCWTLEMISPSSAVCREATPGLTWTPTPTATPTIGPPCGILNYGQKSFCSPPSTYNYAFTFYAESGCASTMTGNATLTFEVAASQNGPWVIFHQQGFAETFYRGYNGRSGSLLEENIPSEYVWYRISYVARFPGNVNGYGFTQPGPICTTQATYTPTPSGGSPTATHTPCAIGFTDVTPVDYFYEAVMYLACHGAISGYGDATFRPFNNVTRGQACKIIVTAFGIPIDTTGGPHFVDVPEDHAFYEWIESAYNADIITGYSDDTFRPYNNLTRAQLTKIICRVIGISPLDPPMPSFSDVTRDHPFYGYIEAAYCAGIITGYSDGTFRPYNNVTRGQTSVITYRALIGGATCGTPTPVVMLK